MLDAKYYLSLEKEKERYEQHNNCVDDVGYQKFVSPIVEAIKHNFENNC